MTENMHNKQQFVYLLQCPLRFEVSVCVIIYTQRIMNGYHFNNFHMDIDIYVDNIGFH